MSLHRALKISSSWLALVPSTHSNCSSLFRLSTYLPDWSSFLFSVTHWCTHTSQWTGRPPGSLQLTYLSQLRTASGLLLPVPIVFAIDCALCRPTTSPVPVIIPIHPVLLPVTHTNSRLVHTAVVNSVSSVIPKAKLKRTSDYPHFNPGE